MPETPRSQDPSEALARRAAARLAGELDPRLPALTERAIAGEGSETRTRSYDPTLAIGLAGFLLSVAQFAWTIYRDLKEDRKDVEEKSAEQARERNKLGPLLARKIRLGIDLPPGVTPDQQDRVIEVVVEEILHPDADPS